MFSFFLVALSDVRLPAALTRKPSAVQINVRRALCFPRMHNWSLWDDNTRPHVYSNRHLCLFFDFQTSCTNPIPTGAEVDAQVEALPEGTADLRGKGYCLAVGWRQSYLNWNTIAASSGLGLSESVETAQDR